MRLEYNDIILRALEPKDVDILYEWENDTEWWPVGGTLIPFSKHMLNTYVENVHDIYTDKQLRLMIEHKDGTTIGCVDLFDYDPHHQRAGVGILIGNRNYQKSGYAGDALRALIDYAFNTLGMHQLFANIGENNKASLALFKGCGFEETGRKKDWMKSGDSWTDELCFQLINKGGKEEA